MPCTLELTRPVDIHRVQACVCEVCSEKSDYVAQMTNRSDPGNALVICDSCTHAAMNVALGLSRK